MTYLLELSCWYHKAHTDGNNPAFSVLILNHESFQLATIIRMFSTMCHFSLVHAFVESKPPGRKMVNRGKIFHDD